MLTICLKYIYCSICRAIRCDTLKILWNTVFIFKNNSKLVLIRHIPALLIIRVQAYSYNWLNYLSIYKQFRAIFSLSRVFSFILGHGTSWRCGIIRIVFFLKRWRKYGQFERLCHPLPFLSSFCLILLRQISIWSMK